MSEFQPDVVIHFAGLKAVGDSMTNPLGYYDVNVRGTLQLLAAMDRNNVRRVIFSSSATVYGEPEYLPHSDASAVLLRYFNPVGAHASAKMGEHPDGVPNNLMPFIAQVAVGKRAALQVFGDDYDTPEFRTASDHPIPCEVKPRRDGDIAAMQANTTRANTELGWRATHTLGDMAQSTWDWQSRNPDGYDTAE